LIVLLIQNNRMTYFFLYSTCQLIKDNLIISPLFFIKTEKKENDASGICFQLLQIPKQIYKTLTFTLTLIVL